MKSEIFKLNLNDVGKAFVMAFISGAVLPIIAAIQTPDFNIFTANWHVILSLAVNGGIIGFVSYLIKNFVSDNQGKVFGKI